MVDSRTGAGNIKDKLGVYVTLPERRTMLSARIHARTHTHKMTGSCHCIQVSTLRTFHGPRWDNWSNKINKVVLGYNSKCRIHIHNPIFGIDD